MHSTLYSERRKVAITVTMPSRLQERTVIPNVGRSAHQIQGLSPKHITNIYSVRADARKEPGTFLIRCRALLPTHAAEPPTDWHSPPSYHKGPGQAMLQVPVLGSLGCSKRQPDPGNQTVGLFSIPAVQVTEQVPASLIDSLEAWTAATPRCVAPQGCPVITPVLCKHRGSHLRDEGRRPLLTASHPSCLQRAQAMGTVAPPPMGWPRHEPPDWPQGTAARGHLPGVWLGVWDKSWRISSAGGGETGRSNTTTSCPFLCQIMGSQPL